MGDDVASWGIFYKSGKSVYSRWNQQCTTDALSPHLIADKDMGGPWCVSIAVDMDNRQMWMSINAGPAILALKDLNPPYPQLSHLHSQLKVTLL